MMENSIINKLRKLLAHAKSAELIGNIDEACAFSKKVQDLLNTHNLSMSDIDIQEAESTMGVSHGGKSQYEWQKKFIHRLASINGCKIMFGSGRFSVVGVETDRLIVIELYSYFTDLGRDLASNNLKSYQQSAEFKRKKSFHSKSFTTSFLSGFTMMVAHRLKELQDAAKESAANSTALIFIGNKLAKADQFMQAKFITKERLLNFKKPRNETAFDKGIKAGKDVALTTKTIDR